MEEKHVWAGEILPSEQRASWVKLVSSYRAVHQSKLQHFLIEKESLENREGVFLWLK